MILIVSTKLKNAEALVTGLSYMGILAHSAHPSEVSSEIGPRYRAAVVFNPHELPDENSLIAKLRAFNRTLPVFAVSERTASSEFTEVLEPTLPCARIASKILDYTAKSGKVGEYRLAGLDLSPSLGIPTYFFRRLPLTPTEAMIIRFLIRAYPTPVGAKEILKYSFRPSRLPEASSVRTHVCAINRKFKESFGRPLIVSLPGQGYAVLTPEYAEMHGEFEALLHPINK